MQFPIIGALMVYQVRVICSMLLLPTQSLESMQLPSGPGTCIKLICKLINFDLISFAQMTRKCIIV